MPQDELLVDLLVRWEEVKAAGKRITPDEICRDTPELLPDFTRLLRRLGHLDNLLDASPESPEKLIENIKAGRYTPRSYHASGGLGIVFLADDQELRRTVALKWMQPPAAQDPAARRRFLLEAEITGKLEHPGVAPVYGAGQDPHGRPYYAMRFIQGSTLADAIRAYHVDPTPTGLTRLLRTFVSICQTVAYAHARGVVHRDLKPGNVMLGPYGETLVVDWGLARSYDLPDSETTIDQNFTPLAVNSASGQSTGRDGQTVEGQAKGSPAYMAPEQARGEWSQVGPAADIYSLGATLYVLLAGRPPYSGTATEVIEAVKKNAPPPPLQVNRSIPPALNAICQKAMAREAADRYPEALELATDIERWLADEPVSTFLDPFPTRARRWVKRHRTFVTAAVAVLVVATVSIATAAILLGEKNRQLGDTNTQLAREIRAKEQANALLIEEQRNLTEEKAKLASANAINRDNYDLADRTITSFTGSVNLRLPGGQSIPDSVRIALNTEARDYYREFIVRNGGRNALDLELAFAHLRQAEAEIGLNHETEAMPLLETARGRFEIIRDADKNDPHARYGLASVDLAMVFVQIHQMKVNEARTTNLRACETFAALCKEPAPAGRWFTGTESPAFKLAQTTLLLRDVEARCDPRQTISISPEVDPSKDGIVLPYARQAEKSLSRQLADTPSDVTGKTLYGFLLVTLGEELAIRNRTAEARDIFTKARKELAQSIQEMPTAYEIESMVYFVDFYLALAAQGDGKGEEVKLMLQARDRLRALASRDWGPDRYAIRERTRFQASACSLKLGKWAYLKQQPQEARRHYHEALKDLSLIKVPEGKPELSIRMPLVQSLAAIMEGLRVLDEDIEALGKIADSIRKEMDAMAPELEKVDWFERERIFYDGISAWVLLSKVKPDLTGLPLLGKAATRGRTFVKSHPDDHQAEFQLAVMLSNYGMSRALFANQVEEGLQDLVESRQLVARYPAQGPKADFAKQLRRINQSQFVAIHAIRAEQLLAAKPLDRAAARKHIAAAEQELAAVEKTDRLTEHEKKFRMLLRNLSIQASEK